jgi:cation:H+ antiporter
MPLIVYGGIAMYIASKALSDTLIARGPVSAGRLAVAQWIPISVLAMAAVVTGREPVAVGLVFSTSVACLALAVGTVALMGLAPVAARARRSWVMLVPVGLLGFLMGLHGSVSLLNAGVLALEGVCVLLLWNDRGEGTRPAVSSEPGSKNTVGFRAVGFRAVQCVLALVLTLEGAWLSLKGVDRVATGSELATAGLLTATLLSPLLVLPIVGTATELSQRDQSAVAISSQVGIALLNVCGLLPLLVTASWGRQILSQHLSGSFVFTPLPFPLVVWRVDALVLVALALFLLPVAIGKWSITRMQGLAMICGYVVYLAMVVIVSAMQV